MSKNDHGLTAHDRPRDDKTIIVDPGNAESHVQHAPAARKTRADDSLTPLGHPVRFGKYKVVSVLGKGGMGVVYKARAVGGKDVAIKVMSEKHMTKPQLVKRFMREFKICQMLDHPNIARAISAGRLDRQIFFVMEFVSGKSLEDIIEGGHVALGDSLDIVRQACLGLHHAHSAGVVHRDIKPGNLIVREDGTVSVIDFGIAGAETAEKGVTDAGCVMGTPYYMSPEQGKDLAQTDQRTDVYAVGICLYEMISGRTPSGLLSPDAVPEGLGRIIGKATSYDRERRYESMEDLVTDIDGYLKQGAIEADSRALREVEDGTRMREVMIEMLFPKEVPTIAGMDLACMYLPAAGVGGNYYDFIDVDGTAVGLLVGNLGQKPNLESMVFLSMVRSAFRLCANGERDPAVALALTNDFIAREEMDCFAVFSYAVIDPEDMTLSVATAGFRPSGLLRAGDDEFDVVESPGLGLGIIEGADYESVEVDLFTDDIVMFTSMGVVKTKDRRGEELGQERLDATVRANREGSADEIVGAIKNRIQRYSGGVAQADDMTVCVLKVK
ncbi:MAG: serine phosphatase RsbU (regulator of sigma subunit) [Myxococcota bacterium]|jgi:serine phosphatase RsbU (regulator of sigma subunit)/tRNA A-37 threonylcarbamoyl transferase component Bud32